MLAFEEVANQVLPELCAECPLRNLCGTVEMVRLDVATSEGADSEQAARGAAVIEADVASTLVLTGIFKQTQGCKGPLEHDEVCGCGNTATCGAYSDAVHLLQEIEE